MVTGFGLNSAGEVGVNYVDITAPARYFTAELAQHITAGQMMLTQGYVQQVSLHYHAAFATILEAVSGGIEMGMALKRPLLMEPWEDMLDWQIEDTPSISASPARRARRGIGRTQRHWAEAPEVSSRSG